MKTRKTKKRNIIRRAVAFLLCMTMVLGLGMQDVIEQVYAEEASAVSPEQSADVLETQDVESTETTTPEGETDPTDSGDTTGSEESETTTPEEPADPAGNTEPTDPANPADADGNTEVTTPPTETTEPTTPADGTTNTDPTDPAAPETPADSNGSEPSGETTPGESTGTDEQKPPVEEVPTAPAETTGEEETPEEELPEEEKTYEAEQKVDNVTIHVSAEAGVLPEDAELSVTPIVKTEITEEMSEEDKAVAEEINAQYDKTEQKLTEELEAETKASAEVAAMSVDTLSAESVETGAAEETTGEKVLEGFLAYDICFFAENENGELTEVEPDGEVNVTFEFEEAAMPDGVSEDAEIAVAHLKEDDSAEDGIRVENMTAAETATVETAENAAVTKVELKTESFSIFTITWVHTGADGEWSAITYIHAVRSDSDSFYPLDDINLTNKDISSEGTPPTLYIDTISETGTNDDLYSIISGDTSYRFVQAFIAKIEGNEYVLEYSDPIEALQALEENKVRFKLENEGEYRDLGTEQVVIFVYTSDAATTRASYYSTDGERLQGYQTYDFTQIGAAGEDGIQTLNGDTPTDAWDGNYGYTYDHTVIIKGGQTIEPSYMRYCQGRLQYSLSELNTDGSEREWIDVGIAEIRLIYKVYNEISTVDTSGIVDISLTDLDVNDRSTGLAFNQGAGPLWGQTDGVWNKWTGRTTYTLGSGWNRKTYNARNLAVQGIVENKLYIDSTTPSSGSNNYTGYPKLVSSTGGSWLEPLFNNSDTISGLNHLFTKDDAGYYSYDSSINYAYFNQSDGNKNFKVYNTDKNKGDDGLGDFMPFNDINDNDNRDNFEFSMNIGFNFTQPEGGKVNGNPMVFEFSGDDDVWVFIDGKLVLDIGGIHDAISGSINFATGKVEVVAGSATAYEGRETHYVGEKYALNLSGTPKPTVTNLKTIFGLEGDTFEDGTTHRLEFFYLERGRGESNCSLKFNLQPQESQTIEVKKEIGNSDRDKYANIDFSFKLYVEDNTNAGTYHVMPEGTTYTIKENGRETGTGTVGENGIFLLKHNQSAVFSGISSSLHYYVEEVDVDSDEFNQVVIEGHDVDYVDQDGKPVDVPGDDDEDEENVNYIAKSGELLVGAVGTVIFENICSAKNLRELKITKEIQGGITTDDTFTFLVELENLNGALEPYSGEYYLFKTENGTETYYYFDEDGELVQYLEGRSGVAGETANGEISGVPAGFTVAITQILSDTSFRVTEEDLDDTKYDSNYRKELKEGTYSSNYKVEGADGEILLGVDAEVTITNIPKNQITVTKDWNAVSGASRPQSIYVGLYDKSTGKPVPGQYIALSADDWSGVFNGVNGRHYIVKELRECTAGEEGHFTIKGQAYIGIDDGTVQGFNGYKYVVDYGELTLEPGSTNRWTITITNSQSWQIVKRSSSTGNPPQSGAVFELTGLSGTGTSITLTGTSGDDGVITWRNTDGSAYTDILPNGNYTLTEKQAPAGFSIGADWTITIADGIPTRIVSSDNSTIGVGSGDSVTNESAIFWNDSGTLTLYYNDDALYELPEAGGPGIHLYMLGGTLLMMAGALLVYKKRKEEVLRS